MILYEPVLQLIQEHVAGDLLPNPRRHPSLAFNESKLGTGFWFFGEAKHGAIDSRGEEAAIKIKNVNSHSLGVVGIDPETKRPRNGIVIPRNTPLPVVAKRVFKTNKDNQKSILVQIVEGESNNPDDCSKIGKCTVKKLPANLPIRTPIEIRFKYEENGRLTVMVQVEGDKRKLQHELSRENSLTPEQMKGWREYIEQSSA